METRNRLSWLLKWSGCIDLEKSNRCEVKNMSKLDKRSLERKGERKQKILENKLMEEHLVDLTNIRGGLEEMSEEER